MHSLPAWLFQPEHRRCVTRRVFPVPRLDVLRFGASYLHPVCRWLLQPGHQQHVDIRMRCVPPWDVLQHRASRLHPLWNRDI